MTNIKKERAKRGVQFVCVSEYELRGMEVESGGELGYDTEAMRIRE